MPTRFRHYKDMAPWLVHVHLKNGRLLQPDEVSARALDSEGGRRYTGTTLDAGVIDVEAVLAELKHLGYDGYFLIEYQGEEDPAPPLLTTWPTSAARWPSYTNKRIAVARRLRKINTQPENGSARRCCASS